MDKKVKYKELAEKAFRQVLKEEEYLLSQQIDMLIYIEVDLDNKDEIKEHLNDYCPFFIEIEDKDELQICRETLKSLVTQKYNNLENEELKPTQVSQLILLMETFSDMTWVLDNLKERVNKLPISAYLVAKLYMIPNIIPEDVMEFSKELNKVF